MLYFNSRVCLFVCHLLTYSQRPRSARRVPRSLGIGARSSWPFYWGKCATSSGSRRVFRCQLAMIRVPRLGAPAPIEAKKCSKNNDLSSKNFYPIPPTRAHKVHVRHKQYKNKIIRIFSVGYGMFHVKHRKQ